MPPRIHLLSEIVANQIAAGEVIERPASVLKELLENSLDAGATQIEVRTRSGGKSLIEVTDNGCGMNRDDALLCLERHATSKLRVSDDLRQIASYGFRGEAIPSIASVSRFALRTREPETISGTEVVIHGGKIISVNEAGLAPGTQIEVRSLFYNLPARRKFLRTDPTELAHVQHHLLLAGLSRPEVGFTVRHDEQTPQRWPAQQSLERRLATIFGEEWQRHLLALEAEEGDLRVTGFIGQPGVSRATRQEQFIFVNRRPVDSRTINFALLEAYHNALMRGRYPVTALFLQLDPDGVDVNVHPAKREVRFHDDARVRHFLVRAVQGALQEFHAAPVSVSLPAPLFKPVPETKSTPPEPIFVPLALPAGSEFSTVAAPFVPGSFPGAARVVPTPFVMADKTWLKKVELRWLGIVARLYMVAESPDGLVLIDQHAAHERVLFEQVLAQLERVEVTTQRLLLPVSVLLPPREADFLREQLDALNRIGVEISEFGAGSFLVDGMPPLVRAKNIEEFIRNLVIELQQEGGETRKRRRCSEETVAKKVCRMAVKANDPLTREEGEALLWDLLQCRLPYTCPHGRPTMILLSKAELERKFGRVG